MSGNAEAPSAASVLKVSTPNGINALGDRPSPASSNTPPPQLYPHNRTVPSMSHMLSGSRPPLPSSATLTETSSYDSDYELPTYDTADLLALLLAPDLHLTFTPAALLLVDNPALFRLLPLVLVALARIGHRAESRPLFVDLVTALRSRLCACRGLKLRFMLLVRTEGYKDLWGVKLIHRAGCYVVARAALQVKQNALEVVESENGAVAVVGPGANFNADCISSSATASGLVSMEDIEKGMKADATSRLLEVWERDTGALIKFTMTEMFDPENGIRLKDNRTKLRKIQNSFRASEAVDWLVERTGVIDRKRLSAICEILRSEGLITRVGNQKPFADDKHLYTSDVYLYQTDDSCACVKTSEGETLYCWKDANEHAVKSVDLKLPVDVIDLQSVDFWSRTVFDKTKKKGDRFGFRLVSHPLMCQGMELRDKLEPAFKEPAVADESLAAASQSIALSSKALASTFTNDLARIAVGQTQKGDSSPASTPSITSSTLAHSLKGVLNEANLSSDMSELSTTDVDSISLASAGVGGWESGIIVSSVRVVKVFSSIARPMICSLHRMIPESDVEDPQQYETIRPNVLIKEGDNLLLDLSTEIMFRAFNNIWQRSPDIFPDPHQAPFILCYEIIPTDENRGFMEVVPNLTSLSDFNWYEWRDKYGRDPIIVDSIVRSAAGSYIGAYVVGARDRHFDNIVVQDNRIVTHIDFGFVLGTSPPIDGPRFSVPAEMEEVFKELGVWNKFVKTCVRAFRALRKCGPTVVRTATLLYSRAGHDPEVIKEYLRGKNSLSVREDTPKVLNHVKSQLEASSTDWKAKFKSYSHQKFDPVFYGLLEKRFPPAVLAMKLVNHHREEKKSSTKGASSNQLKPQHSAEEVVKL